MENFALEGGYCTVSLFGLGRHWDLHSFARLARFSYEPARRAAFLEWVAPAMANAWGDPANRAKGCRLVFDKVGFLRVGMGEPGLASPDESMLADVSKVVPGEGAYRWKDRWGEQDPFRLLFRFESGRTIEVESESVRLEPVEEPD